MPGISWKYAQPSTIRNAGKRATVSFYLLLYVLSVKITILETDCRTGRTESELQNDIIINRNSGSVNGNRLLHPYIFLTVHGPVSP